MSKQVSFEKTLSPVIILVRPQLSENIGMVARAIMNCALSDLRLVAPRENHLSDKAVSASSGAQEILQHATVYESLTDALTDINFLLATTARPRDMTKPVYHPEKAIRLCLEKTSKGMKTALLFGAERTGLENHELILADGILEIPLNPKHSSLNLAQAVLLTGYTWFSGIQNVDNSRFASGASKPASKAEVALWLNNLKQDLDKKGYFHFPDKRERMEHNLENIFTRIDLTQAEIKTLYSVLKVLKK
jgi:tRNA/rRNA methyltransferase